MFILTDDMSSLMHLSGDMPEKLRAGQVAHLDQSEVVVTWQNGTDSRFTQPNMLCLGLVTLTSENSSNEALRSWWLERCGVDLDICAVSHDAPETKRRAQLWSWVANKILSWTDMLHAENRNLLSQNRSLRRSYGALQMAFSRLEHFVSANHLQAPVLHYETTPIASHWKPTSSGAKLNQLLPILSTRLSFFELHFRKSSGASDGVLRVALRLEPSAQILHVWEIAYGDLLNGWNSFAPPPTIDEQNEVLLELVWSESVGAPAIGLSTGHWNKPYGALPAVDTSMCYSLAVRIWSGIQGVRPPNLTSSPAKVSDVKGRLLALAPGDLARAQQHEMPGTQKLEYEFVSASVFPGRLLVHPHQGEGATIAFLPETVSAGTTYFSAECKTANPEASVIEYAMAVVRRGVAPEAAFSFYDSPSDGFSGWHSISPMELRRIYLVLEAPATGDERLCFATRLPPGSSEQNAWATYSGVEFAVGWRPRKPILRILEQSGELGNEQSWRQERGHASAQIAATAPKPFSCSPELRMDRGSSRLLALAPGNLARARQHEMPGTQKFEYESVSASAFPGQLLVHPHQGEGATIAVLPETVHARTTFLSVECKTASPEASVIEYAMAVVPHGVAPEAAFSSYDSPSDGFSGWHSISPIEPRRIYLVLETPATGDERLCFATRLPSGSSELNAWATYSGVEFAIGWRPETVEIHTARECPKANSHPETAGEFDHLPVTIRGD